eukprot:777034-Amphidinium_carterae.1
MMLAFWQVFTTYGHDAELKELVRFFSSTPKAPSGQFSFCFPLTELGNRDTVARMKAAGELHASKSRTVRAVPLYANFGRSTNPIQSKQKQKRQRAQSKA